MSKAKAVEHAPRPLSPYDKISEPIGTFAMNGRRVTTPSGVLIPRSRPVSSQAARMRSIPLVVNDDGPLHGGLRLRDRPNDLLESYGAPTVNSGTRNQRLQSLALDSQDHSPASRSMAGSAILTLGPETSISLSPMPSPSRSCTATGMVAERLRSALSSASPGAIPRETLSRGTVGMKLISSQSQLPPRPDTRQTLLSSYASNVALAIQEEDDDGAARRCSQHSQKQPGTKTLEDWVSSTHRLLLSGQSRDHRVKLDALKSLSPLTAPLQISASGLPRPPTAHYLGPQLYSGYDPHMQPAPKASELWHREYLPPTLHSVADTPWSAAGIDPPPHLDGIGSPDSRDEDQRLEEMLHRAATLIAACLHLKVLCEDDSPVVHPSTGSQIPRRVARHIADLFTHSITINSSVLREVSTPPQLREELGTISQADAKSTSTTPRSHAATTEILEATVTCEKPNTTFQLDPTDVEDATVNPSYTENCRSICIGYRNFFFEIEVIDSTGKALGSSEIFERLQTIVNMERKLAFGDDDVELYSPSHDSKLKEAPAILKAASLSLQPPAVFVATAATWAKSCLINYHSIEVLNQALMFVTLSENACETGECPSLGIDCDSAQWVGNALQLTVLPNCAAILRCSALFARSAETSTVAAWISHAANIDPMLPPVATPELMINAMRRSPTRPAVAASPAAAAKGKPGKSHAATQPVVAETITTSHVKVKIPCAGVVAKPREVPFWMPRDYVVKYAPQTPTLPCIISTDITCRREHSLHLALLLAQLALNHPESHPSPAALMGLGGGRLPKKLADVSGTIAPPLPRLHLLRFAAPAVPELTLCRSEEIDAAVKHLRQYTGCGTFRTEIQRACTAAVASIERLVTGPAYLSVLQQSDTAVRQRPDVAAIVKDPPSLVLQKTDCDPSLPWVLETTTWPVTAPTVSYYAQVSTRSAVHPSRGTLYTLTFLHMSQDRSEALATLTKEYVTLLDAFVAATGDGSTISSKEVRGPGMLKRAIKMFYE